MIGWNAFALLAVANLAPAAPPSPEQVMALPPDLRQQIREQVIDQTNAPNQRLQRLLELVFQQHQAHATQPPQAPLHYDTAATLSVADTWAQRRANCLSFTLLFVAAARAAGLEARVQEVRQVVTWYEDQGVIYNAGHVNVGLRVDGLPATLDLDQNVLYDHRGPQPISDRRALAHFYNNRGSELLAAGQSDSAREHFRMALQMAPDFAPAWNNLGVLENRSGNGAAALQAFHNALALDPALPSALSNASALYQRNGDEAHAQQLQARLQRAHRRDPFYHFMQGVAAERRGDYPAAIDDYRQAIHLYPGAHQFQFGLARAYSLNGDNRRATRAMQRARTLGDSEHVRAVYQAKLNWLHMIAARQRGR